MSIIDELKKNETTTVVYQVNLEDNPFVRGADTPCAIDLAKLGPSIFEMKISKFNPVSYYSEKKQDAVHTCQIIGECTDLLTGEVYPGAMIVVYASDTDQKSVNKLYPWFRQIGAWTVGTANALIAEKGPQVTRFKQSVSKYNSDFMEYTVDQSEIDRIIKKAKKRR